ncbi:MAG TPA: PQQ-binding-like beta-propeller repeat protein [Jatrophihabitantaceae bacterium]|nr:PQQ-binding-like beta-propeller repeat protein [Jatrophihabitantaceae bacterium]
MRLLPGIGIAALLVACTSTASPSAQSSAQPAGAPAVSTASVGNAAGAASTDWRTYHGNVARTGVSTSMPAAVGNPTIAKAVTLDGAVYASPIVAKGITIVATEHDSVYAFDSAGNQLWVAHLGTASPAAERPCGNIDPLGITGTPVYDTSSGLVFVAPEYSGSPPRHELVGLILATGAVKWHTSIDLPGVDQVAMQERGALTVAGGSVWVPFGGLAGDCGNYKGRVVGMAVNGAGSPISYTVPTTREAGIWTPPGPTVDSTGRMYVAVGNGASGVGDPYDFSDSVLALNTSAQLVDSFSPTTWASDNAADKDLGSQGPAIVGQWIFQAGKSGTAYVLRRSALGGIGGEVSQAPLCASFGGTAVQNSIVYVPCTDGLRAVKIDSTGHMKVLWHAASTITGSPVIGGGRIWSLDTHAGVLYGLDPKTGASLGSVSVGAVSRFATPALSGKYALVPTLGGYSIVATS